MLRTAIAATGEAYRFETVVTVGGEVTTVVIGAVSGDAQLASVETGDAVVEYLKAGDGEWVKGPDDDDWVPVDDPVTVAEPLGVLDTPREAVVTSDEDGVVKIRAVYPGDAIGADQATVTLRITIRDGHVYRLRYEVPLGAVIAEVDTLIADVGNVEPIAAPGG